MTPSTITATDKINDYFKALASVREKVVFRQHPKGFYPKKLEHVTKSDALSYEEVESMLMDELAKTGLHYEIIGDDEFQQFLDKGMKALENASGVVSVARQEEEMESEEIDECDEEEEEQTAESILYEFITELGEEMKANEEEPDEDYLLARIARGLKARKLEVQMLED